MWIIRVILWLIGVINVPTKSLNPKYSGSSHVLVHYEPTKFP